MNKLNIFIASAINTALLQSCVTQPTNQDLECREIVRNGQDAKTQQEYDYAKKRFDEKCNGWSDPYQKK